MASLRDQFVKSYGSTELNQLDQQLSSFAKDLRGIIQEIILGELQKDATTDAPHSGFLLAGEITMNVDPANILRLKGFEALRDACAAKDVDVKIFVSVPSKKSTIGYTSERQTTFKVMIDLTAPHSESPQAKQKAPVKLVQQEEPKAGNKIGFAIKQRA